MELIDQRTKKIMEGCKERARNAGLRFSAETLEYIVTNRDLLELTPKGMIPGMYDYWVQDVEVLKETGRYELYPTNPYETVINTRPAISFYNDNNPDWLNVMIFYHVLAHIDFFQNNIFFRHTWEFDFNNEALADKRLMARLRSEKGRWVDYVIEFARGIDNLVSYHHDLSQLDKPQIDPSQKKVNYYFDVFLQKELGLSVQKYLKEIKEYNRLVNQEGEEQGIRNFFVQVGGKYPEFEERFKKFLEEATKTGDSDLILFLMEHSEFLNKKTNKWMKSILEVVRKTSVFFQPQIRTKIMNEGWATYWHEKLFLQDERIQGHEIDFSRVHSKVASLSRVGLNPYAIGLRLFQDIEESANKGRLSREFEKIRDIEQRKHFDVRSLSGKDVLFELRKHLADSLFIQNFITQDFVDQHRLFVSGKRLNRAKRSWEYYVKSRKAEDFQKMLLEQLYHPPFISYRQEKDGSLALEHRFEGKPLVRDYIANTMLGIEYLWGKPVTLLTHELEKVETKAPGGGKKKPAFKWKRVQYTMKDRQLSKVTKERS